MEQAKLDLAKSDFELECKEKQKHHPCRNEDCEDCDIHIAIKCIEFYQSVVFCNDCAGHENCWTEDNDYCSHGWRKRKENDT